MTSQSYPFCTCWWHYSSEPYFFTCWWHHNTILLYSIIHVDDVTKTILLYMLMTPQHHTAIPRYMLITPQNHTAILAIKWHHKNILLYMLITPQNHTVIVTCWCHDITILLYMFMTSQNYTSIQHNTCWWHDKNHNAIHVHVDDTRTPCSYDTTKISGIQLH